MSYKVKDISIKNEHITFKIDENSNKNILIYYIGYVTIKQYLKIYSASPLYLIFRHVNGYLEQINERNI